MSPRYVILDRNGLPVADLTTREPITFRNREEARRFIMPGESLAAWLDEGRRIVPVTK